MEYMAVNSDTHETQNVTTIKDVAVNNVTPSKHQVYDQVLQKFEFTQLRIEEAKQEIESFFDFCKQSAKQCPLLERDNYGDWYSAIEIIKRYASSLGFYTCTIKRALHVFESHINSLAGNVSSKYLQVAEKTVEILSSVQIKAENCKKEIQEKTEEVRNL